MKRKNVGIIAEDESDVDVIKEIVKKIWTSGVSFSRFIGHGHGKIVSRCGAWSRVLHSQGCTFLIIAHDSDGNKPGKVSAAIASALGSCAIKSRVIVVPVREIEAWLLADHEAINSTFSLKQKIGKIPNPEAILRPKERLRELVFTKSGRTKRYVNAVHNGKIAAKCSLAALSRCASFRPLRQFLATPKHSEI